MDKKDNKALIVFIVSIVALILLWLFLRKQPAVQQIVKQNVPWAVPLLGDNTGPDTYNVNAPGYTPASMPGIATAKCDSNSPCIFCTIPNVAYPSNPVSIAANVPATVHVTVPKTFQKPTTTNIFMPELFVRT